MKKNLRIVSAAAAALLAVAPVAASAVSTVSAADGAVTNVNSNTNLSSTATNNGFSVLSLNNGDTVALTPNISLSTSNKELNVAAALNASFTATVNGTTATSTFKPGDASVKIWAADGNGSNPNNPIKSVQDITKQDAGKQYKVQLTNVELNFGTANANKKIVLSVSGAGNHFPGNDSVKTLEVTTSQSGVATIPYVVFQTTAYDLTNTATVNFFNRDNGQVVTSGDVSLYANAQTKLNINAVKAAIAKKYAAAQVSQDNGSNTNNNNSNSKAVVVTDAAVTAALKALGSEFTPDSNGYFTAPKSFVVNATATSNINNASATLPVTVNVENGKVVTPATVDSVSKRIMHNAYFYDKDAKRVGTDSVKRYASVSVLPNTTTINGKAYYQVVENGKAVDKYINAGNIDGTKRTLKHNAYVYASSKKRANKVVLKKGEVVTTYGASYTFKNGQKYYKIGDNTDKTYVKVANFR